VDSSVSCGGNVVAIRDGDAGTSLQFSSSGAMIVTRPLEEQDMRSLLGQPRGALRFTVGLALLGNRRSCR